MRLSPTMIMSGNVFPKNPFYRGQIVKDFFKAAKSGDCEAVKDLLKKERFLVYEFDNVHQTALHWAAKRNKSDIIKILIANGAKVN